MGASGRRWRDVDKEVDVVQEKLSKDQGNRECVKEDIDDTTARQRLSGIRERGVNTAE